MVKETGAKKLYTIGIIDDYSRACWLKVIDSIKAMNVMFASLELLIRLKERAFLTNNIFYKRN